MFVFLSIGKKKEEKFSKQGNIVINVYCKFFLLVSGAILSYSSVLENRYKEKKKIFTDLHQARE